jgi:hypothetical protein
MEDDYKRENEKLKEIVNVHHYAITCLVNFIRERIEMEAEFWSDLLKCLEEVK